MFWLRWKRFVGSHFFLRSRSRSYFSGPNTLALRPTFPFGAHSGNNDTRRAATAKRT